ncbi:hypothetical protein P6F26_05210 [Roseibacterium sp. SDUM158017]|uniref:hypothetical protein n=1 Tax=Roseicyclus salinarum TaxID=3036773 RepID=UPI002415934C|nr:hypothetical protein [Roseibacterium sp. SDUM158017]MDG4647833.1 hypothetical protein [Roseibacterium sp. SDUM158017]
MDIIWSLLLMTMLLSALPAMRCARHGPVLVKATSARVTATGPALRPCRRSGAG